MKKALTIGLSFLSTVSVSLAQINPGGIPGSSVPTSSATGILALLASLKQIMDAAVPILIGLAVLGLFWFLFKFIWAGASKPEARSEAMKGVGASLIAILVMVSIWGIIAFLANTLGLGVGGNSGGIRPGL
jgi:hypothetical protein